MKPQNVPLSRTDYLVTLTIHVKPAFRSRMQVMVHDLVTTSCTDDGCILFFAAESLETEGLFLVTSAWRDREAYDKHRASPYVRAFESQIVPEILRTPVTSGTWQKLG